jgi:hypothetical protein
MNEEIQRIRDCIKDCMCPFCNGGPFRCLATHTRQMHDINKYQLRDMAEYSYSESICDSDFSKDCAKRALSRPMPTNTGKSYTVKNKSKVWSKAYKTKLDNVSLEKRKEMAKKATIATKTDENRKHCSEIQLRIWEEKLGPPQHGTERMYRLRNCRCDICRAGNTARHREFINKKKNS